MRLLLCSLLCLSPLAATESRVVPFRLYTAFQHDPPAEVLSAIRTELEQLMAPIGWDINWTSLSDAKGVTSKALAIVRFKGDCNLHSGAPNIELPHRLGETFVEKGEMLPFSTIYCDVIRSLLTTPLMLSQAQNPDYLFGRAVARVVAHELFHILTGQKGHAAQGLAQEQLTAQELLSNTLRFQFDQVQSLRIKLVPILLATNESVVERDETSGYRTYILSGCSGCHGTAGQGTPWGPSLQGPGKTYDSTTLEMWLKNRRSEMYRRARMLDVEWPSLERGQIDALADYLMILGKHPVQSSSVAR